MQPADFLVASLLTSNILSAAKIVEGVSIFGTALVIDAGTFIFPLCYILGDLLTEVYGYKQTKKVIWVGFFSSLVLIGSVYFISLLPAIKKYSVALPTEEFLLLVLWLI